MIEIPPYEKELIYFKRKEPGLPEGFTMVRRYKTPIHIRLLKKCIEADNGCWEWTGAVDKETGYGKIGSGKQGDMKYTHRVSASWYWYNFSGDCIPEFLPNSEIKANVHHTCHNRRCVNPKHLTLVSRVYNSISNLGLGALNKKKTGCPYGHGPYDKVYSNGHRYCSKCKNEKEKRRRARLRGLDA